MGLENLPIVHYKEVGMDGENISRRSKYIN